MNYRLNELKEWSAAALLVGSMLALAALLSGCAPLSEKATIALFESIKDRSSCLLIGGGMGGGVVTVGPSIPMTGGYGYFWSAHAMPTHSVEINKDGCKVTAMMP